jgi:type II secretory pathway pseudopilin PulG
MSIASGNKGFTVVEILLAFFIFSILFVTIYASYTGSFNTINLTEARMEKYRKAAIALDRISEDLSAAYISILPVDTFGIPSEYTQFLGEDSSINGREADSMSFFSRIAPIFSDENERSTGQLITYEVIQGANEGELVLLRSESSEFIDEIERGGLPLSDGLQAIKFTYTNDEGEVLESWDSDAEENDGILPRIVTVVLEYQNYENPEAPLVFMTSVVMPVQYMPQMVQEQ